jgi:hypothetical protein
MKTARSIFIALSVLLVGCSAKVNFSSPYHLDSGERIVANLDPVLLAKVEHSSVVWEKGNYELGSAFDRVIVNRSDAPSKIEYVSSDLTAHQGVSWFMTGMVIAEYRLTVKHTRAGQSSLIDGQGKGVSYWNSFNACQEAIEKAIIDLVAKIKASR